MSSRGAKRKATNANTIDTSSNPPKPKAKATSKKPVASAKSTAATSSPSIGRVVQRRVNSSLASSKSPAKPADDDWDFAFDNLSSDDDESGSDADFALTASKKRRLPKGTAGTGKPSVTGNASTRTARAAGPATASGGRSGKRTAFASSGATKDTGNSNASGSPGSANAAVAPGGKRKADKAAPPPKDAAHQPNVAEGKASTNGTTSPHASITSTSGPDSPGAEYTNRKFGSAVSPVAVRTEQLLAKMPPSPGVGPGSAKRGTVAKPAPKITREETAIAPAPTAADAVVGVDGEDSSALKYDDTDGKETVVVQTANEPAKKLTASAGITPTDEGPERRRPARSLPKKSYVEESESEKDEDGSVDDSAASGDGTEDVVDDDVSGTVRVGKAKSKKSRGAPKRAADKSNGTAAAAATTSGRPSAKQKTSVDVGKTVRKSGGPGQSSSTAKGKGKGKAPVKGDDGEQVETDDHSSPVQQKGRGRASATLSRLSTAAGSSTDRAGGSREEALSLASDDDTGLDTADLLSDVGEREQGGKEMRDYAGGSSSSPQALSTSAREAKGKEVTGIKKKKKKKKKSSRSSSEDDPFASDNDDDGMLDSKSDDDHDHDHDDDCYIPEISTKKTKQSTTASATSASKRRKSVSGEGNSSGAAASAVDSSKNKGKGKGRAAGGGGVMTMAKPAKLAGDVEVVLRKLRRLREGMVGGGGSGSGGRGEGGSARPPTLQELGLSGDVTEVREVSAAGVMDEIERIAVEVAESIMDGKGFGFRVPTRSTGNQKYIEELDRIVLGDKVSHRNFVSTSMARKTAITTRVVQLVHQVLGKGIHITKRDMFYTDVKLFKDQAESDAVLDDVACMVGCTRSCLNVVASDKGLVVGRVSFLEDGDMIDCTRMGVGGKAIPPYIDKITDIKSDADFILLVEKEAAYMRMAEDRFYQKYPCIVITAKGQPDVATRLFLKRLKRELNIPVMGLVDSDPYGLKILSVYMSGSKNMSYDSASLTTPDIKWLGVRPSDLDRYNIPEQCRLDMTDHDIKTGKELLQEDFIKKNAAWYRELELMIKSKKKAEIQSLSAFGFQYLTETYLPQKLQNGDWV